MAIRASEFGHHGVVLFVLPLGSRLDSEKTLRSPGSFQTA
jgi:hypothetical protein